jgi:hypothetical protein
MENGRLLKHQVGYDTFLRAVGRFCDQEQFDEISLIEFEKGFILQGLKVQSTSQGYIRSLITHTWSYEEISKMAEAAKESPEPLS